MSVCQSQHLCLTHHHREQAPSHSSSGVHFTLVSNQTFKSCTSAALMVWFMPG